MSLKTEFTTAWKSFKAFVVKTDVYLQANEPKIQADVKVGEAVAVAVAPALAPVVTVFDGFEEALVGEVTDLFHSGAALVNSTTGETTVTLSAQVSGVLQHLANTLAGHPTVVAAVAAKPVV